MYWILVAVVAAEEACEEEAVCLLSLRQSAARAAERSWENRQADLRAWGREHATLKRELERGRLTLLDSARRTDDLPDSWLDDFVAEQNANGDACHSKVLEAKRTMDGLAAKVLSLSDSIEGHEAVIEGNTQLIRDNMENKDSNDDTKSADDKTCDTEYADALAENQKYRVELDELDQMANPAVRSSVAHDLDVKAEIKAQLQAKGLTTAQDKAAQVHDDSAQAALLQAPVIQLPGVHAASLVESCSMLSRFLAKVTAGRVVPPQNAQNGSYVQLDCNATREGLQQEYTEAYIEITKLFDDGEQMAADDLALCKQRALGKHTGNDGIIDGALTKATRAVQSAKDVIEAFEPILDDSKSQVQQLEAHIAMLQTTCVVDEQVTGHLKKVRMLIDSLDKCPGRNDFQLTVPDVTGKLPAKVQEKLPEPAALPDISKQVLGASAPVKRF